MVIGNSAVNQAESTSIGHTLSNHHDGDISPTKRGLAIIAIANSTNQSYESINTGHQRLGLDMVSGVSMRQQKETLRNAGVTL